MSDKKEETKQEKITTEDATPEEQSEFGKALQHGAYELDKMTIVTKEELKDKNISVQDAFVAKNTKYKDSEYAVLILPENKFVILGGVVADQIKAYKDQGHKYPVGVKLVQKTSGSTGNEYWMIK